MKLHIDEKILLSLLENKIMDAKELTDHEYREYSNVLIQLGKFMINHETYKERYSNLVIQLSNLIF